MIGLSKSARAGYSFDDVAVAPHRRTRDPEAVDLGWQIDAYGFALPLVAAPMDSIMSPETAIEMGQVGWAQVKHGSGHLAAFIRPRDLDPADSGDDGDD